MPAARRFLKYVLIGLSIVVGFFLLLISPFIYAVVYYNLVPAQSAEHTVTDFSAKVSIDLYLVAPYLLAEYERYLTVTTPSGTVSKKMFIDWGGASRTSLYRTPDRRLVILGPAGDDYAITPEPLNVGYLPRPATSSDDWVYLGAFDMRRSAGRATAFDFLPASEQPECIPSMGTFPPGPYRSAAYRERC